MTLLQKWFWPLVLTCSACGAAAAAAGLIGAPLRAPILLWFLLVCPGMALVRLLYLPDWLTELTLAVGASMILALAVSLIMVYARLWHPAAGVWLLCGVSLAGGAAQLRRRDARPHQVALLKADTAHES